MQTCWKCGGNINRGEGIKTKTIVGVYAKHWHKNCYKLATKEEKE